MDKNYYSALGFMLDSMLNDQKKEGRFRNTEKLTMFYAATSLTLSKEYKIDDIEIKELYQKLIDDKYIRQISNGHEITFDGILFVKNGGYVKQKKSEWRNMVVTKIEIWSVIFGGMFAILYSVDELSNGKIQHLLHWIKTLCT